VKIVSVIIPVFNSIGSLENAVFSTLSHESVGEVIIIDDGSIDGSLQLALRLSLENSILKVYFHPNHQNLGVSATRNLGIQKSNFPFIAFLDSDDYYLPNRFEESIRLLNDNPEIDACFGFVKMINTISQKEELFGFTKRKNNESVLTYLLKGGYFHTNSILVRKSILDRIGYFDTNLMVHEDVELWIRIAFFGSIESIIGKEAIAVYNYNGSSLIHKANSSTKILLWNVVLKNLFFCRIGFKNRYWIIKQMVKVTLQRVNDFKQCQSLLL